MKIGLTIAQPLNTINPMGIITLTTDFGLDDWFVGTMKGVILSRAPRATIVDVTHGVPAGDITAGAFALAAGCGCFPRRTVHVAVVDPGVGGARGAIAVQTANYFFVGPDNGVLSLALAREKVKAIHRLTNKKFFLPKISRTFHGRDVFAPVAAALVTGVLIQHLGPAQRGFYKLDWPTPTRTDHGWRGEVVYVDRFGNAITNLCAEHLAGRTGAHEIRADRTSFGSPAKFYQTVPRGEPVTLIGSAGFLELAVNDGSAAEKFGLRRGTGVAVKFEPPAGRRKHVTRRAA